MRIILIPGLGYDTRIFGQLDLSGYAVEHLQWIEPKPKETIQDYARRWYATLPTSTEKTVLIGHSMGGVLSQEIAGLYPIEQVILVSSLKARRELPYYLRLIQPLRLEKLFTKKGWIATVKIRGAAKGHSSKADKALVASMLNQQSNSYLQWALKTLSAWQGPPPFLLPHTKRIHLHGNADQTLPYKFIHQPDYTIEGGSHICVLKKAAPISTIIRSLLPPPS